MKQFILIGIRHETQLWTTSEMANPSSATGSATTTIKPARREPPKLDWNKIKQNVERTFEGGDEKCRCSQGCNRCMQMAGIIILLEDQIRLLKENAELKERLASREGR